jgi:hypothetical protein
VPVAALLVAIGVGAYLVDREWFAGSDHRWVVVLYAEGAAAALGATVLNRWRLLRAAVEALRNALPGGFASEAPSLEVLNELRREMTLLKDQARQIDELKAQVEQLRVEASHNNAEILQLEAKLKEAETAPRLVVGAILEISAIVLGALASILWAKGLA